MTSKPALQKFLKYILEKHNEVNNAKKNEYTKQDKQLCKTGEKGNVQHECNRMTGISQHCSVLNFSSPIKRHGQAEWLEK